jgi:hypothetical protein
VKNPFLLAESTLTQTNNKKKKGKYFTKPVTGTKIGVLLLLLCSSDQNTLT